MFSVYTQIRCLQTTLTRKRGTGFVYSDTGGGANEKWWSYWDPA